MKRALVGLALVTAFAISGCGPAVDNDEIIDDPTPIEQEPLPGDDDLDDLDEDDVDDGTDG